MAITVTGKGDFDNVKKGLQEVQGELSKTDQAAQDATDDHVFGELIDDAQELKERIEAVADAEREVGDAASEMKKAGDAADKAASSAKKAEANTKGWESAATGLNAAFELGKDALEGILAGVEALAERGNPAAIELKNSFDNFKETLFSIADDPRFQNTMADSASSINDMLIPALKSASGYALDAKELIKNGYATAFAFIGEKTGILTQGTLDAMRADQERSAAAIQGAQDNTEALRQEAEVRERIKSVTEDLARIDAAKAAEGRRSTIAEIDDQKHLQDIIADSKEQLLDPDIVISKEKQAELVQTIADAERRVMDLQRQARQQEKQAAAERQREQEELAKNGEAKAEANKSAIEDAKKVADAEQVAADKAFDNIEKRADAEEAEAKKKIERVNAAPDAAPATNRPSAPVAPPEDPEAYARRIARETGRGVNTVKQMMRRGDVGPGMASGEGQGASEGVPVEAVTKGMNNLVSKVESIGRASGRTIDEFGKSMADWENRLSVVEQHFQQQVRAAEEHGNARRGRGFGGRAF